MERHASPAISHYLHLLAELSQPEHTNPRPPHPAPCRLAHCFTQLAEAADQIAAATFQTARGRKPARPE